MYLDSDQFQFLMWAIVSIACAILFLGYSIMYGCNRIAAAMVKAARIPGDRETERDDAPPPH